MNDEIVINPVTRIEGHAKVTILLWEDGSVKEARLQVTDFRGFEKFCEGRPFYEMPSITSRSCGICPVSHLLASVKACDEILAVSVPSPAILLRRLMHMGQLIQSHALSFFHLSSPDFLLGIDSDPSKRNIFGLMESHPYLVRRGIRLRKFGQEIIEYLGGKRIHSSDWVVPGGVKTAISKERVNKLLSNLPEALEMTLKTISMFKDNLKGLEEEIENFGNFPTHYMGLVAPNGGLEHYDGGIRIVDPEGKIVADQLDPRKYFEYIEEAVEPWTYMKFPYYKPLGYPDGAYRVGPLARLNIASHCGTPLAEEELREFKQSGRNGVVHSTFLYHYARLVEILFCLERAKEILEDEEIYSDNVQAKASPNRNEGIGVAEAPRGTLIHHYKVNKEGIITWVNMIIATENNNVACNMAITQVAKKYIHGKRLSEGLLNKVEAVIRAFDPCLSCATHASGSMALDVQLLDSEGNLIDRVTC
ncbi:MAG: Ni/Fe hydrogenase subunit alpha [Candidatus Bathyarchaeota archaeon]|nr:Ni/Fe hydrogenase subunit alpha [Candidatus Bathyarchaeota archaeon]MDH5531998.1 Ni/Fe hydrogenase subunit alpha [Candidatus Bathyarchaeota archaeon]MDH5712959.1 Ni/Fe hydrogenase subunit alpha [Candidatus Bathyarchaeota archaeon]